MRYVYPRHSSYAHISLQPLCFIRCRIELSIMKVLLSFRVLHVFCLVAECVSVWFRALLFEPCSHDESFRIFSTWFGVSIAVDCSFSFENRISDTGASVNFGFTLSLNCDSVWVDASVWLCFVASSRHLLCSKFASLFCKYFTWSTSEATVSGS